jgi:hypothetical protein
MWRVGLLGLLVASSIAFAALAQEESQTSAPVERVLIRFDEQPSARDFGRHYPSSARFRGIQGAALMCCSVRDDRRLDCTIPLAWPAGYGFDTATLAVAAKFRVSEESYAALQNAPIQPVRRWILWPLGEITPEFSAAVDQVQEAGRNLCLTRPEPSGQ